MRWLDRLKSLFGGQPPARRIATLDSDAAGGDAATTVEMIVTGDEPLKPHHRRRALRDSRLLPKAGPKRPPVWPRSKRPRYFAAAEARRLFSPTLRTANRQIRDLTTDDQQLARYGLPLWQHEQDLADALGLSVPQLRHYSIHRTRETSPHYVTFAIPKRSGGHRLIHAPKRRLKAIQRRLLDVLVSQLPVSSHAHGFLPQRSVGSNAALHTGKAVVIKLDLQDCFPSVHFGRIRGLLIALGYGYPVATTLAVLMTECERQPVEAEGRTYHVPVGPRVCVQGAPTSPGLVNALLLRMDRRLAGLARKYGYAYTRYADDLTFSGNDPEGIRPLLSLTDRIVREEGFRINRAKTRVLRRGRRQRVTGVVVNDQPGLSRQDRRRLRAELHQLQGRGPVDPATMQRLRGKLAYLHMLNPVQAAPLEAALQKLRQTPA